MPFEIVRNDITKMKADAIVDTANPQPKIGWGVDAGIHKKAGPGLLLERLRIGAIPVGGAAVTKAYGLEAKFVIHTVGPVWQGGGKGEEKLLRGCYEKSLALSKRKGCKSIAFPLISAGNHGFPKDIAMKVALDAIRDFLLEEEMLVYLVVYSQDAFALSEKLFRDVASYIDDNYTLAKNLEQYGVADKCQLRSAQQSRILEVQPSLDELFGQDASLGAFPEADTQFPFAKTISPHLPEDAPCPAETLPPSPPVQKPKSYSAMRAPAAATMPPPVAAPMSLEELLKQEDKGFSARLLELIDRSGKKDSQIYSRANVSRQHFSKIRNNAQYKPTKATALAFAIALELDMEQTRDLIGRAGYALTKASKFDLIIMYFIQAGNYNIFDINAALFEFDQSLLGG